MHEKGGAEKMPAARTPATGAFLVPHAATGLSADLLSGVSVAAHTAGAEHTYAQTQTDKLTGLELQGGVNTDEEMQNLLLVEQAFAANARVITTLDQLIQTLIGL